MKLPDFDEFRSSMRGRGYPEVTQRTWQPGQVVDEHTHPFDADALVVEGEMWLTCQGSTRHLKPGDTFYLEHGTPHSERYGPAGATYWVGRRPAA